MVCIEKDLRQHVDIPPQSLKLGRRPYLRFGTDEFPEFFKFIHQKSMHARRSEKKIHKGAGRAQEAFFQSAQVSPTIKGMELIRFLIQTIIELVRDTAVNLSGRASEEFIAKHVRRRKRRKRQQTGQTS
jgi:hypothetical protein